MFKIGDAVKIIHNGNIGAVIGAEDLGSTIKYTVLVNGKVLTFFEDQLSVVDAQNNDLYYSAKDVNSLLTARLILNPSITSLYSLNSAKIDFIPYQFRPVLKIIKSDSPRILIADGVGVGKTIEAGLVLKELEARFDIKSVMVICPRPLITEKKWQNELKRFGEKFVHIDGKQLRYCIEETINDDGEWPSDYQKCIVPYSLFDESVVFGTSDGGLTKLNKKSLIDMTPFPKFDLVIIDEAHHIKNPNTYAYQAAQMFCDNAESIVLLTATPIQLGDKDLYVLLNLIRPDLVFDYDSFKHMSEPNPFINEAAKLIRGNKENWKEEALDNLVKAGNTNWGTAMLIPNPVYQNAVRMLNRDKISLEDRVKLIAELTVESLHWLKKAKMLDYAAYATLPTMRDFDNHPGSRYKIFATRIKEEFEREELFVTDDAGYDSINSIYNAADKDIKTILSSADIDKLYQKKWLPTVPPFSRVDAFIKQFSYNITNYSIENFIASLETNPHFFDDVLLEHIDDENYYKTLYFLLSKAKSREDNKYSFFSEYKKTKIDILKNVSFILCDDNIANFLNLLGR